MKERRARVAETMTHAVMTLAMLPCMLTSVPIAFHAAAAAVLLTGAAVLSVRARRDQRHLAAVLDSCAMTVLVLIGLMSHHGGPDAAHHASGGGGGTTVLTVITVAGWAVLRTASWSDAARAPGARRAVIASSVMVVAMAATAMT